MDFNWEALDILLSQVSLSFIVSSNFKVSLPRIDMHLLLSMVYQNLLNTRYIAPLLDKSYTITGWV